jgi:hypothetical protein
MLPGQKIQKLQFCAICSKYGIQEPGALKLLDAFHKSGVVLNFSSSSSQELRDTVFVRPQVGDASQLECPDTGKNDRG